MNGFTVTQGPISILSVSPSSGLQGQTLASVVITARNTAFVNGTTVADFGAGITVNSLTVNSGFKATANITIQSNATAGARTLTVTTGTQVVSKTNGFTVTVPSITSVTPNSGQQGETLTSVAIIGQNTHFVQGTTVANFGAGITINSLTVNSVTSATANITVANNIILGFRTVKLTTGTEVASLVNGFTVTQGPISILSASPSSGLQGQTLASVIITARNTALRQRYDGRRLRSGNHREQPDGKQRVQSDGEHHDPEQRHGRRTDRDRDTGTQVVSKTNAFTVTVPSITSVTPNSGQQGQTLTSVAIIGQNTHFVQGTTVANFGAGITINSLTVNSATIATANITVANNIILGFRTVKLTTGTEVASLVNGFTVTQGPISILSASPSSGQQGQTLASVIITARNTAFVNGTTVADFGAGITVNSLTVNSAFKATANITIQSNATAGARTVTVTTGTQVVSKTNAFTVTVSVNHIRHTDLRTARPNPAECHNRRPEHAFRAGHDRRRLRHWRYAQQFHG